MSTEEMNLQIKQLKTSCRQTALSTASYMQPRGQVTIEAELLGRIESKFDMLGEAEKIYQWLIKDL